MKFGFYDERARFACSIASWSIAALNFSYSKRGAKIVENTYENLKVFLPSY